jgi:hypothetical protein
MNEEFDLRLRALGTAAREAGFDPRITSGYRSGFDQARAINSVSQKVLGRPAGILDYARGIPGYAAPVGGSEHEKGLAADWGTGPALDWLRQNAPRYGVRFPESLAKTDPIHSEIDSKFYGPVQDPRAREDQTVAAFDTKQPPARMSLGNPPAPAAPAPAPTGAPPMADPYRPQPRGGFLGLIDALQGGMGSPLFQSGAAMYAAASQGKDIGTGFLMGGEATGRAAKSQAEQAKMQRETMAQQQRDQMWQQLTSGQTPAWASGLPAGTLELARALGPDDGPKILTQLVAAQPQREEAAARLKLAQNADNRAAEMQPYHIAAATRKEEPPVVQQMIAAGIPRGSPEWVATLKRSLPGGSPTDRMMEGLLAPSTPQMPAQSPSILIPQSGEAAPSDPNLIRTQAAQPQMPPPAQFPPAAGPQAGMIDTPFGPKTADEAKRLGFALALGGKGDAGKMVMDSVTAGDIGKEGRNELDKKMISASDNLANLSSVRARFRPEFQQIENRLGMAWTALADKFKKGQALIKPEDRAKLEEFSAYRSDALDTMNNYIKAITGAAMTDSEAKRILGALPSVGEGIFDGDGPTAFKAKLDAAFDKTAAAIARYNYARQNGKDWQMIGIEQMKTVVRNRGKQIEQELLRSNPNFDRSALPAAVTKQIKREFGI